MLKYNILCIIFDGRSKIILDVLIITADRDNSYQSSEADKLTIVGKYEADVQSSINNIIKLS